MKERLGNKPKGNKLIPCNILITAQKTKEIESYMENFIQFLNCPLKYQLNEESVKIYEVKDKVICFLAYTSSLKLSLFKMSKSINFSSNYTFCCIINDNFNVQTLKKNIQETRKFIQINDAILISFEEVSEEIRGLQGNDLDILTIKPNDPDEFYKALFDEGRKERKKIEAMKKEFLDKSRTSYLNKKRRKIFSIEKVPRFNTLQNNAQNVKVNVITNKKPKLEIKKSILLKDENKTNKIDKKHMDETRTSSGQSSNILTNLTTSLEYKTLIGTNNSVNLSPNKIKLDLAGLNIKSEIMEDSENSFSRNSLISISKEVFKYIQSNRETKGFDVTNHILKILQTQGNKLNYKNIQRRVYDAINVMSAIGIIRKEKGNINITAKQEGENLDKSDINHRNAGNPGLESNSTSNQTSQQPRINEDENELQMLEKRIEAGNHRLISACGNIVFLNKLLNLNSTDFRRNTSLDRIDVPFYLLNLNQGDYNVKQKELNNKVSVLSTKPIKMLDPTQVTRIYVQKLLNYESLLKDLPKEVVDFVFEQKLIDEYLRVPYLEESLRGNSNQGNFSRPDNSLESNRQEAMVAPENLLQDDYMMDRPAYLDENSNYFGNFGSGANFPFNAYMFPRRRGSEDINAYSNYQGFNSAFESVDGQAFHSAFGGNEGHDFHSGYDGSAGQGFNSN